MALVGNWVSCNGELINKSEAVVSVDDINFAYGYGVYETMKVRKGLVYFPERHEERLFHSAEIIELEHRWKQGDIVREVERLVRANEAENANIKALLIGGSGPDPAATARLYIMTLSPLFPDRKLYRDGVSLITFEGERQFPQSKSLSMTMSSLAFKHAGRAGAYDALLVDRDGYITEGTRTNLYYTDGRAVYTPPAHRVLTGVTKLTLEEEMRSRGMSLLERDLHRSELPTWESLFLTSTSSKVMPVSRVDTHTFQINSMVREVMELYDRALEEYAGRHTADREHD
jgi:branched-subunit amino acid aminotransferase/4-amino-4-deoxychorismate lyase